MYSEAETVKRYLPVVRKNERSRTLPGEDKLAQKVAEDRTSSKAVERTAGRIIRRDVMTKKARWESEVEE